MFRFFRRPEAPPSASPSPSDAGRVLSARAHAPDARARRAAARRAERDRIVKAHCAAILNSMNQQQEPAE